MNKFLCYDDIFIYNDKLERFELPPKLDVWFTDDHEDLYRIVTLTSPSPDDPTYILFESSCGTHKGWTPMFEFINSMHFVKTQANLPVMFWLLARSNASYRITSDAENSKATYSIIFDNTVISGPSMLDVIYELYLKVYNAN